jgi:thymidylate synthase
MSLMLKLKKSCLFYNIVSNITNYRWKMIFMKFWLECQSSNDYNECINFSYSYSQDDCPMSFKKCIYDFNKSLAMKIWYKNGDPADKSILKYFKEYQRCIDSSHQRFNSNYGYYAFKLGGLARCISKLKSNQSTRQAMFCINNNDAMSDSSIDKLCTNTIQFFIRNSTLDMYINMRSSNFLTLLPYDSDAFSLFFSIVFCGISESIHDLKAGKIHITAASLHFYDKDFQECK